MKKNIKKYKKLWMYGGAGVIMLFGYFNFMYHFNMNIFFPMPIIMVILGMMMMEYSIIILPLIYLIEFKLLSESKNFSIGIVVVSILLFILNTFRIIESWEYGLKYQGEKHTYWIYIISSLLFIVHIIIAFLGHIKKNQNIIYFSNLLLFTLLAWYIFPYLGEI